MADPLIGKILMMILERKGLTYMLALTLFLALVIQPIFFMGQFAGYIPSIPHQNFTLLTTITKAQDDNHRAIMTALAGHGKQADGLLIIMSESMTRICENAARTPEQIRNCQGIRR